MRNLKKYFNLLLIALFTLILVGCGEEKNDPEKEAQDLVNEEVELIYVTGLEDALADLSLPKYYIGDSRKTITWTSNSENLVIAEFDDAASKELYYKGQVVLKKEASNFVLTATLKYEYADGKFVSATREFAGNIVADEWADNSYDTIAAAKSVDGKTSNESKIKFTGTVTFANANGYIVSDETASIYVYGSSHNRTIGEVVTVRGVWASYNNMPQVATGAVASVISTTGTLTYETIAEEKSITEIMAIESAKVDAVNCTKVFKTTANVQLIPNSDYNTYKLTDPLDTSKYVEVSKYNDTTALGELAGYAANGKAYEMYIIIYCSRSTTDGIWDVLYIPTTATESVVSVTDEQKANNALTGVSENIANEIYKDVEIELPAEDKANGATFKYEVVDGSVALSIVGGKLVVKCQDEETVNNLKVTATVGTTTAEITIKITVGAGTINWITVSEAIAIYEELEKGATSESKYFIYGTVKNIDNETYCNFYLTDGTNSIYVYGLSASDNSGAYGTGDGKLGIPFKAGDKIFLQANVMKYHNTKYDSLKAELTNASLQPYQHDGLQECTPLSVADAITLTAALDADSKEISAREYYLEATVKSIDKEEYCNLTITDGTSTFIVYGLSNADGSGKYGTKDEYLGVPVQVGSTVLLLTKLQNYGGKYETNNAKLISHKAPEVVKKPQLTNPEPTKEYSVNEIIEVMKEYDSGVVSTDMFIVKGKVVSSSYNSDFGSYTMVLEGTDGKQFELYSIKLDSSLTAWATSEYQAENAFNGCVVVCKGYLKLYNTTYEMPYLSSSPNGSAYSPVVSSVTK